MNRETRQGATPSVVSVGSIARTERPRNPEAPAWPQQFPIAESGAGHPARSIGSVPSPTWRATRRHSHRSAGVLVRTGGAVAAGDVSRLRPLSLPGADHAPR